MCLKLFKSIGSLPTSKLLWWRPGFPDENFSKKSNSAKKRSEKGQTDCLKARKEPNFVCGVTIPLSQKTSELQEYHSNFSSKIILTFAWHCTGAHYWCFSDFSWFVRLHTMVTMRPHFAYWSINIFPHPYESHLPSTPVLTTRIIIALLIPRRHCRITIAGTLTCLQALNLLKQAQTLVVISASPWY